MSRLPLTLSEATGLTERDVRAIISNAPLRYKIFSIPKRGGGRRIISQPARELKALQRILVNEIIEQFPIHPSATAYRKGMSIMDNASAHAGSGPILKFDFSDFFPSIQARDWRIFCEKSNVFTDEEDIYLSTNILFSKSNLFSGLRLAIGAPSSPSLSNILMFDIDRLISDAVAKDRVIYTRYADDLTFSAQRTGFLNHVPKDLAKILREVKSPSLTLNSKKTVLATRKFRRVVTGLTLTNDGVVSVGREKKRLIRAALHRASHGDLSQLELAELNGSLGFVKSIEPGFFTKMLVHYGSETIDRVREAARTLQDREQTL